MAVKVIRSASCDGCETEIDTSERWVDAMVYGVTFHERCWKDVNGPVVARLLELDDIYYYQGDERLDRAMAAVNWKENQ